MVVTGADRDFCGLSADSEPVWLTYAEAAKRVTSTKHTVQLWRRQGMPMEWRTDNTGQRFRVVEEETLLAWWRQKMKNSPVHFYKMRRKLIEAGETPPPIPERFRYTRQKATGGDLTASTVQTPADADTVSEARTAALTALLADLTGFPGQPEHAALMKAMEDEPPACDGLEVFTHDRFDDPEQTEMMRGICRDCPLVEMCAAFAAAGRPSAGMWAGMTPAEIRAGVRSSRRAGAESGGDQASGNTRAAQDGSCESTLGAPATAA